VEPLSAEVTTSWELFLNFFKAVDSFGERLGAGFSDFRKEGEETLESN
jgi:hypothetical protein